MLTGGGYSYDAEDRITSAGGVTYTYNGDGERVQKSNGKLYWGGSASAPLVETDAPGAVTSEYVCFNRQAHCPPRCLRQRLLLPRRPFRNIAGHCALRRHRLLRRRLPSHLAASGW